MLQDDFSDGDATGWSIGVGTWSVTGGQLVQADNVGNAMAIWSEGAALSWSNYTVTAHLSSDDDDHVGIVFLAQDGQNHYRLYSNLQNQELVLAKVVAGNATSVAVDTGGIPVRTLSEFQVVVGAGTLTVFIDGQVAFGGPIAESTFTSGTVGFYNWFNKGSRYHDINVTPNE